MKDNACIGKKGNNNTDQRKKMCVVEKINGIKMTDDVE